MFSAKAKDQQIANTLRHGAIRAAEAAGVHISQVHTYITRPLYDSWMRTLWSDDFSDPILNCVTRVFETDLERCVSFVPESN